MIMGRRTTPCCFSERLVLYVMQKRLVLRLVPDLKWLLICIAWKDAKEVLMRDGTQQKDKEGCHAVNPCKGNGEVALERERERESCNIWPVQCARLAQLITPMLAGKNAIVWLLF